MVTELANLAFLDGLEAGTDQDTVVIASYPRSGNTLIRAYIEKISGIVSGSDCDITKKLNQALMHMGLAGEGLVDKRVLCVKTHYPERYGKTKFGAERCVLLVRSPLDCITSLFNMVCSGTHNLSIEDTDFERFPDHWSEFIQQEITVWKDFHDFWLKARVPVHIVRYEDIIEKPEQTLTDLMKFVLNVQTLDGTRMEQYIKLAVKEKAPEVYKPRKGKVNGNLEKYKPIQLDFMKAYATSLLTHFNYIKLFETEGLNNTNGGSSVEENKKNDDSLSWVKEFNKKSLKKSIYNMYENDEICSIMINYPALLLRKKSALYPDGRTSYRFKR